MLSRNMELYEAPPPFTEPSGQMLTLAWGLLLFVGGLGLLLLAPKQTHKLFGLLLGVAGTFILFLYLFILRGRTSNSGTPASRVPRFDKKTGVPKA